jgi:hypothetical protein
MNFISEFIKRLKLPTPAFFSKIRNAGLAIAAIGAGLQTLNVAGSKLLPILQSVAPDIIVVGTVVAIIAQATAQPEKQNKEL